MASVCPPCLLTDAIIDALPDDSPIDALDLLDAHGIVGESVETTRDAQELLRNHVRSMRSNVFLCKDCNLIGEDLEVNFDLIKAKELLEKHKIKAKVQTLEEARTLLKIHLQMKNELLEEELLAIYGPEEVAKVVQHLVEQNRSGRLHLLEKQREIRAYLKELPAKRLPDINRQLPHLDDDMVFVEKQLQRDNFTIMIAGETGSGKSCLLNLLLGKLGSELLSVNNLPSTSVITEIKYGEQPTLKAHQAGLSSSRRPHCQPLELDTAPEEIAKFTHQKGDRTYFKYNRVEVFWPCEWIKNGITITDTPGVGENDELTQMVKDYIPRAYGFIYVINTPNAGGINPEELEDLLFYHITKEGIEPAKELSIGEHASHIKFNPKSAIFVCNKWDLVSAEERDEVKQYVNRKLKKVWRDFDFDQQVFFLSAEKTKQELKTGHVSKEFRRLLRGVQNLLPAGFKTKLEKQFWSMFHIMDRCTWVLKNFILCGSDSSVKKRKRKQYKQARARLGDLETQPDMAREEMKAMLDEEVSFAKNTIQSHMKSPEVQGRLMDWKETECPDVENLERLQSLQESLAQQRVRREVSRFEEEEGLFEGIQKRLLQRFQSVFLSVDSELASIESAMKNEDDLSSLLNVFNNGIVLDEEVASIPRQKQFVGQESAWVSLGLVVKLIVMPASAIWARQRRGRERKELAAYRENKPKEMARITGVVLEDFLKSGKLQEVIARKLEALRANFSSLFDRIPELIKANQRLLSQLEQELDEDHDFSDYIEVYNKGVRLQDSMNFLYMTQIRTYEIDMSEITDTRHVGEGNFATVKRGRYQKAGKVMDVALKRLKRPLDDETATEFVTEEINLQRVQGQNIVKFIGTTFQRKKEKFYPVIVQEFCPISFSDIVYNKEKYLPPGCVAPSDPRRPQLMHKAAEYSDQISRGLRVMHSMGFVHRDFKPENLLVSTSGGKDTIKLCDLGISKREADIIFSRAGTPLYMAPEVLRSRHYDRSADIFSLGLVFWEIWYGKPIAQINADDNYKKFKRRLFTQNAPPTDWQDIIERCLSSEPTQRPTATDCLELFSKYYSQHVESGDFQEIKKILSEASEAPSDDEMEDVPSADAPEEGVSELYWIERVGLQTIVDKFKKGEEITEQVLEEETVSLTENQTAAVWKRVVVLNRTLRQMRGLSVGRGTEGRGTVVDDREKQVTLTADKQTDEDDDKTLTPASLLVAVGNMSVATPTEEPSSAQKRYRHSLHMTKYLPRTLIVKSSVHDQSDPLGLQTFPQMQQKRNDLPNFSLPSDVDLTRVCDLSTCDLEKVRRLSLLELTALYDSYGLVYQPLKKKKGGKEKGVFGVPLQVLHKSDLKKDATLRVPQFYQELVRYIEECGLDEQGILRVTGSKAKIKQLRSDINQKFRSGKFSWDGVNIHEATALLKQLLRELPIPLMTHEHFNAFTLVETIPDYSRKLQLQALNLLVLMLPAVHRNTLQLTLELLRKIVDYHDNKMTLYNVSMVMSPNLFPAAAVAISPENEILFVAKMTNITQMLIKYQDIILTVPSFMLSQLRNQNELEQMQKQKDKDVNFVKRLFQKKKSKSTELAKEDTQEDFSQVTISILSCVKTVEPKAVPFSPSTKVKDVISRFSKKEVKAIMDTAQNSSESELCLYEVGGNIGERRLHADVSMLEVYKVNPKAKWVLKPGGK